MAVYKPPKLKRASEFLTNKKVKTSTPEKYYEVTSQKLGLYDLDTAYKGSIREEQEEKAAKRKASMPSLSQIRAESYNYDPNTEYLSQEEVGERNRAIHNREVKNDGDEKGFLERFFKDNATDSTRATLRAPKVPSKNPVAEKRATLSGTRNDQETVQTSRDRNIMTDGTAGEIRNEMSGSEALGAVGRTFRDLPRNIAGGVATAIQTMRKSGLIGGGVQDMQVYTKDQFEATPLAKLSTYEEYKQATEGQNRFAKGTQRGDDLINTGVEKLPSKVTEETTLLEKVVRGAALSTPSSYTTMGLGGLSSQMISAVATNPLVIELARNFPLFTNAFEGGLEEADELGVTGMDKALYAVQAGLIETVTERMANFGIEGKLLGLDTVGKGMSDFFGGLIEEGASEGLAEIGGILLRQEYGNVAEIEEDLEAITVATLTGSLMGGLGAAGELKSGLKFQTKGIEGESVVVETSDGRTELVNPEVVAKHMVETTRESSEVRRKAMADLNLKKMAEAESQAQTEVDPTMPPQAPESTVEQSDPETDISTTEEVKPVTERVSEQKVDTKKNVGYHYGDLGKAEYLESTEPTRGTGHYGTGTYFVGNPDVVAAEGMKNRPVNEVDFTDYNLYKPKNKAEGYKLHDTLKAFNGATTWKMPLDLIDSIAEGELYTGRDYGRAPQYLEDFLDNADVFGLTREQALDKVKQITQYVSENEEKAQKNRKQFDSPSTVLMKELGYEGIDVRGIEGLDNEEYGSVIYDIKGNEQKVDTEEIETTTTEEVANNETRQKAETKLNNMIEKKLIDTKAKRETAEKLNKQIVELGGKDRGEEFKKVAPPKPKKAEPKAETKYKPDSEYENKPTVVTKKTYKATQKDFDSEGDLAPEVTIRIHSEYADIMDKVMSEEFDTYEFNDPDNADFVELTVESGDYRPGEFKEKVDELYKEARAEIKKAHAERQKALKTVKLPEVKKSKPETIRVKSDILETNNMGVMDSDGGSDVLYPGEGDRVFKTSQTKKTLMESDKVDQVMKDRVIADDPMLYEKMSIRDITMETISEVKRRGYDTVYNEIMARYEGGEKFTGKYNQSMIQSLMKENQYLRRKYKDTGYYQEQFDKLKNVYRESGTEEAQGLAMRKEMAVTPIGKALEAQREVEKHRTKEQQKVADDIETTLDDIFGDDNLADPEKVAEKLDREFKLPKDWIDKLKKDIADENLTKAEVKERLEKQLKVPSLTQEEFDRVTEIAEKMDALDPESDTYEEDSQKLTNELRRMIDEKNITIWQKISSIQTMAMLMNVKTTLRNEIGNFLGFTTGQIDDVFSFVFDMPLSKLTGKTGVLRPAVNPKSYNYFNNMKESFKLYNNYATGAQDGKYQKKRVFAPGSNLGKLEGVMSVMLSDARHKESRINMMMDQIDATAEWAKENGKEFDAESFKNDLNFYADYNTFNFDSKLATWLDSIVKTTNEKFLFKNKDFGLGTILAKFAKTPMNIVQYQLDHLGADILREGVRTSKLSRKYGMKKAIEMNQTRISRAFGKTATGATYIALGALLSNAGAFNDEEEDKDVKALLEANGVKGSYFNYSALRRAISGGEKGYQEGDTTVDIRWMLPVAPFLILGSRLAKVKDEAEQNTILDSLQTTVETMGASMSDFAELPFNRTLGILTSPYYSGTDKFNQILAGTVTGFVPSPVKQLAQGIDPTSKAYSKNTAVAFGQQIKAAIPGLRNTVPTRFDIKGEPIKFTDNEAMGWDILEMFLNPAYTDTVKGDKDIEKILETNKRISLPSLPKVTRNTFSYGGTQYEMTPDEHQQYQKDYFEAYKRFYTKKNEAGNITNAHDRAIEEAKKAYFKRSKINFQTTESGRLKTPQLPKK